jgi:ATP-dependent Clp protease ATP-binding subunit ClpA
MKIVGKFLVELKNMVVAKGITIKIDDRALDHLVDKGFDPKMGARPLQRVIDKEIKRPLSRQMLFGDLKNGGEVMINVNADLEFTLAVTKKEVVIEGT